MASVVLGVGLRLHSKPCTVFTQHSHAEQPMQSSMRMHTRPDLGGHMIACSSRPYPACSTGGMAARAFRGTAPCSQAWRACTRSRRHVQVHCMRWVPALVLVDLRHSGLYRHQASTRARICDAGMTPARWTLCPTACLWQPPVQTGGRSGAGLTSRSGLVSFGVRGAAACGSGTASGNSLL
jgi:hypothetical protein